jgi:DNA-binding CsgD family transcriptional regulator/tetratricopeptide (TPR) repeat protein
MSITLMHLWCGMASSQIWPEGDEFIHRIYREHSPQTAQDFQQLADSIATLKQESACIADVASRVFLMNAWAFLDEALPMGWKDQIRIPESCQLSSARYHILVGAMHYRTKDWLAAASSFEQAIQLSRDSVFLTEAYNNLSATFEKIPERVNDVIPTIETALRYANRSQSPFLLNNIIALNIQMGNWSRAEEFAQRLPQDLTSSPNNLKFNILLNQMILDLRLNPTTPHQELLDEIFQLQVTPGNECTFGRLASKYLLMCNDYNGYSSRYTQLLDMIDHCPEAQETVQTEGLLYPPWREQFNPKDTANSPISLEAWQSLRRTQFHFLVEELDHPEDFGLPTPSPEPDEESQQDAHTWIWMAAIAGIAAGFMTGWFFWRQRRSSERLTRKHLRASLEGLKELVNQRQSTLVLLEEIKRLESEWLNPSAAPLLEQLSGHEFTPIEEEILRLLANGRTSKEIAILLDISLSHVYNIRTGLRKKFKLSESDDLDAWISDQASILGRKRTS